MPEPVTNNPSNKEFRLHVAAVLYFLSRLAVVAFMFTVPALYFILGRVELPLVIGGAALSAVLFVGYYLVASGLRCPACSSPVLMDNGNRKHPNAVRFPGLNHRARIAWDILLASSYQCMYCVTRCRCKKSWGRQPGRNVRTSTYEATPRPATQEIFPSSIFGEVGEPVSDADDPGFSAAPVIATTPSLVPERATAPVFAAASVFPNACTVPVSLTSPPPAPPAHPQPETAPAPVISPLFATSNPAPAPMPWSIPTSSTTSPVTVMNSPLTEPAPANNPFLAAAAAMPPPPTPILPAIPSSRTRPVGEPVASFHQEFPYNPAAPASSDGPPPWTIPSVPVDAPVSYAPVSASAPVPSAPMRTPAPAAQGGQLLKEVVGVLEEGQRALASAFQSLIAKLEASLTAPPAAPVTPPAPQITTPVPVQPVTPELPELLMHARPAPVIPPIAAQPPPARPQERTTFVPLPSPIAPPQSAPVFPTAPALPPAVAAFEQPHFATAPVFPTAPAVPAPAAPVFEQAHFAPAPVEPAAPRRRFARPDGLSPGQLNEVLQGAFVPPAPAPAPAPVPAPAHLSNGQGWQNGHGHATAPILPAPPPAIPPRQYAPPPAPPAWQDAPASPFGIADSLYAPAGAAPEQAPFTFLQHDGQQFAPVAPETDPLGEDSLPWMQPIGAGHTRR